MQPASHRRLATAILTSFCSLYYLMCSASKSQVAKVRGRSLTTALDGTVLQAIGLYRGQEKPDYARC